MRLSDFFYYSIFPRFTLQYIIPVVDLIPKCLCAFKLMYIKLLFYYVTLVYCQNVIVILLNYVLV